MAVLDFMSREVITETREVNKITRRKVRSTKRRNTANI